MGGVEDHRLAGIVEDVVLERLTGRAVDDTPAAEDIVLRVALMSAGAGGGDIARLGKDNDGRFIGVLSGIVHRVVIARHGARDAGGGHRRAVGQRVAAVLYPVGADGGVLGDEALKVEGDSLLGAVGSDLVP